jgi:hypothetical protein
VRVERFRRLDFTMFFCADMGRSIARIVIRSVVGVVRKSKRGCSESSSAEGWRPDGPAEDT